MKMLSPFVNTIKKYKVEATIILILFFAALIRCYEITLPYCKSWEIAFQEIIAKNHLIYGFGQTHFVSVISVVDGQNIYHLGHQPLLQILIAISYFFFGIHEWSARIVPILSSLGTIILIYAIAYRVWDQRTALSAAFFAAFMPMSAYFGRVVNFEPLVLFFILLFAWACLMRSETNNKKYFVLAVIAIILGGLTDWPFFLILPFFVIISLITRERIRETLFLFILGCGIAAGYLAIKNSLVGYQAGISNWFAHILYRSDILTFIGNPDLYSLIISRMWNNFSISIVLAIIGIIIFLHIFRKEQKTSNKIKIKVLIPPALFLFGLSYLIIFLQSTFVHEWQMYYLIPGISFFAGFTISHIFSVTMQNRIWTNLLKLIGILLIVSFLIISVQCIMTYHNAKSDEAFNFGSRINEWTKPGDYICVIGLINPITYYADRPSIQNPTVEPVFSKIREIKPKIVVFSTQESIESTWSRKDLRKVLQEENYRLLTIRPSFEIWTHTITVPEILVRDVDTIDVRDSRTGDLIPNVDTREYVSPYSIIHNQSALFEHPVINGTIRTNYIIDIPKGSLLTFGIGLNERTWDPTKGDGVQFEVFCQSSGNETRIFSQYTDPKNNPADRKWQYYSIPFDTCIGNDTKISFATSPGPKNDISNDWAYWINPRIEVKP
jgi:hypothetical protein